MDRLERFYSSVEADAKEIIARLGGMPQLVERFLGKFLADESFDRLYVALAAGETKEAFREAHTLKGVCANLGIQSLYVKASAVTELLRAEHLEEAKRALPDLEAEYKRVVALMNELGIAKR